MYKVIKGFYDMTDPDFGSYHLYNKGDTYPREGREVSEERVDELTGFSLIEEVKAKKRKPKKEAQDDGISDSQENAES